jgi:DNA-binding transcriptional LysR family regulator
MPNAATADLLLRRGLKFSHIRLIAHLAESGHIGQTAAHLGTTQPAASRLLSEIERIVGAPVHERTGRGMALTPLGRALAQRARRIQQELGDAARELAEITAGTAGHVRIGAVTAPALDLVLPALRTARMATPEITAEVTVAPSDVLIDQLAAGHLDFALCRLPAGTEARLFDIRYIGEEPVVLVVRRGHALLSAEALAPADLLDYDWLMPGRESPLWIAVHSRLAELGLPQPTQRLSTASFLLTLALIQQSNAIAPLARAVGDRFASAPDAPFGLVPIDLGITVPPYGLVTRAGSRMTPAAERLAALMAPG